MVTTRNPMDPWKPHSSLIHWTDKVFARRVLDCYADTEYSPNARLHASSTKTKSGEQVIENDSFVNSSEESDDVRFISCVYFPFLIFGLPNIGLTLPDSSYDKTILSRHKLQFSSKHLTWYLASILNNRLCFIIPIHNKHGNKYNTIFISQHFTVHVGLTVQFLGGWFENNAILLFL